MSVPHDYYQAAFSILTKPTQEGGYRILDLSAMRQDVAHAILAFLYTDDYEDDRPPRPDETRSCDLNALVYNHAIGLNLAALMKLSVRKYEECVLHDWSSSHFTNSLAIIYSCEVRERAELRAMVRKVFEEHGKELFDDNPIYLSSLVATRPLLREDLTPILLILEEHRLEAERRKASEQATAVEGKMTETQPVRKLEIRLVERPNITEEERRRRSKRKIFVEDITKEESAQCGEDASPNIRRGTRKRQACYQGDFVSWKQFSKDYLD
jgi:hypothetical protein